MVNIDKLNETIESLDIKSKEIDGVLEMQKKFKGLSEEIEIINNKLQSEKKNLSEMQKESKKVFIKSQEVIDDVGSVVNKKFDNFDKILKDNNNIVLSLENELKQVTNKFENIAYTVSEKLANIQKENSNMIESITTQNKNILNDIKNQVNILIKGVNSVEENIKQLNSDTLKQLSEIKIENYKMINELQGATDTKLGILKSDIVLEIRKLEETLENKISSSNTKVINEFKENEKNSVDRYNNVKSIVEKQELMINTINEDISKRLINLEKKNMIFMIIIIILSLANIVLALK